MAKHVVIEAILGEDVGLEVLVVVEPVVGQFLRAEHQDGLVAQLVVLDHSKRGESFSKAHAVSEDAAVVGLQLVDQAGSRIAREVEQLVPDKGVLVTRAVIREDVLAQVFQELAEDVVEHQEVDALGGVLLIHRGDVVAQPIGDIFQLVLIVPNLLKQIEEHAGMSRFVEASDYV